MVILGTIRPEDSGAVLNIKCLTLGLSRGMNGATLNYGYSGTIRPEDSGAVLTIECLTLGLSREMN